MAASAKPNATPKITWVGVGRTKPNRHKGGRICVLWASLLQ